MKVVASIYRGVKWPHVLVGVFLAAFAVRLIAIYLYGVPHVLGLNYENGIIAINLVEGRGYTFDFYGTRPNSPLQSFMPPLYTWLTALCLRYSPNPPLALELIQALLSSSMAIIVSLIATKLSSKQIVGILAGAGVALYPVFIIKAAQPHSFTLNSFLLSLIILSVIAVREKPTPLRASLTGLIVGVGALAKPILLGVFPVLLIWLWLVKNENGREFIKVGTYMIIFMVLGILPWTIRNYRVHGRFVMIATEGGITFWAGNNPFTAGSGHEVYVKLAYDFMGLPYDPELPEILDLRPYPLPREVQENLATIDEVTMDRLLYRAGLDFIITHPRRWLQLATTKLWGFWWFRANIGTSYPELWLAYYEFLYVGLLVLLVSGLLLSLRDWRTYSLLYLLFLYYTLVHILFHVQTRYRWEIEPYFLVFAAYSIYYVAVEARIASQVVPVLVHPRRRE